MQIHAAQETIQKPGLGAGQLDNQIPALGQNLLNSDKEGDAQTDLDVDSQAFPPGRSQSFQTRRHAVLSLERTVLDQKTSSRGLADLQQGQSRLIVFRQGDGAGQRGGLIQTGFGEVKNVLEQFHILSPQAFARPMFSIGLQISRICPPCGPAKTGRASEAPARDPPRRLSARHYRSSFSSTTGW